MKEALAKLRARNLHPSSFILHPSSGFAHKVWSKPEWKAERLEG
jgi:hypothetical protein